MLYYSNPSLHLREITKQNRKTVKTMVSSYISKKVESNTNLLRVNIKAKMLHYYVDIVTHPTGCQ